MLGNVGCAAWKTALAPALPQLVWSLRRHGELDIDALAHLLWTMSAAAPLATGAMTPRRGRGAEPDLGGLVAVINLFTPQQKLLSKTRTGAKVTKIYDTAQTPYQRLLAHLEALDDIDARALAALETTNPAAARREVARLRSTLLERVRRKTVTARAQTAHIYRSRTKINKAPVKRASSHESTNPANRAS